MLKKFFNIFSLTINLLFVVLLLISGFSTNISPEKFILPGYLGLAFLPLLVANVLYVFFWAIKLKWNFVISLIVIILFSSNIRNVFPLNREKNNSKNLTDSTEQFSVLTYNVKLFDFYKKDKSLENYNKTIDYILEQDADIVCLQEFGYYNSIEFLSASDILSSFAKKYKYRHIAYKLNWGGKSTYGVATFSKFPIVKKNEIEYDSKYNHTIYSDILILGDTVRLFNCHLESNQLTQDDKKKMLELVEKNSTQESISETTGALSKKLGSAYKKRAKQAKMVAEKIKETNYDILVIGDFNDSPISYAYKTIRGSLSDAFVETSSGLGISYNELPFLYRIDYILHSEKFLAGNFKVDKVKLSDHYPVSCTFQINQNKVNQ